MGIVNVTPDSFSDGGAALTTGAAIAHCERLLREGADILDIGGESTRPGARAGRRVEEELARVLPVLARGGRRSACRSRSTPTKPEVMRAALDLGADIVNDIARAARRRARSSVVAAHPRCGVCLMHMRGDAGDRCSGEPRYDDVVAEVGAFLRERDRRGASAAGIGARAHRRSIPGIGFGKTPAQNLELLRAPATSCCARPAAARRLVAQVDARRAHRPRGRRRLAASVGRGAGRGRARRASSLRVHDVRGARVDASTSLATVAGLAVWRPRRRR